MYSKQKHDRSTISVTLCNTINTNNKMSSTMLATSDATFDATSSATPETLLKVVATNKFGDCCYQEDPNGTVLFSSLCDNKIWTIIHPSSELIEKMSGEKIVQEYNGTMFMTTKFAKSKFPMGTGNGSACVVKYTDNTGKVWYIMVSDNKTYLQICCGSSNKLSDGSPEEETPKQTMVRELLEELLITTTEDKLVEIGSFSFRNTNVLINLDAECVTTIFMLEVTEDAVQHLLPPTAYGLHIVDSEKLSCKLDETQFVYFVPQEDLSTLPEEINGKRFSNHHRGILNVLSGITFPGDLSVHYPFLSSFVMKLPQNIV